MTTYKLTYFGFDGGRGEPIRIACHAAGLDLSDHRISFDEFRATPLPEYGGDAQARFPRYRFLRLTVSR